jgi:hypothetical protein
MKRSVLSPNWFDSIVNVLVGRLPNIGELGTTTDPMADSHSEDGTRNNSPNG